MSVKDRGLNAKAFQYVEVLGTKRSWIEEEQLVRCGKSKSMQNHESQEGDTS